MSIYQLLRYSVAFLNDGISDGYTPITIHECFLCLQSYESGTNDRGKLIN